MTIARIRAGHGRRRSLRTAAAAADKAVAAAAAARVAPSRWCMDDSAGFEPIFDGKTLNGWDGDPAFWRVENGAIVGQSTPENAVKENTFIIWRGGEPKDFELKVQFRMNATNSGIQIRSIQLPAGHAGRRSEPSRASG